MGSFRRLFPIESAVINYCLHYETGAGEGIRTLDPDLGKVVLYP